MTRRLNRRIFLRGLGGAVVAAPFLGSIMERAPIAKAAPAAGPPRRLIAMFTHYGCVTNQWFPAKSHGQLTAADLMETTLAPLAPFVDKLLIPRGIRSMNEWTANMTRGQGNDSHTQIVGSYFTCQPVTPNSNNPFSFEQATKFNAKPIGPSLDHVMAEQLSPNGTPLVMSTAGQNDNTQSAISYSAAETAFKGLNAMQAFSGITGLFEQDNGGTVMTPDTYATVRGKSVTDLVKDDLETLERFDMSRDDRDKLEAWKALLNQMGGVMVTAQCNQELGDMLGASQANVSAASRGGFGTDILTMKINDTLDGADVYSAIAVLAAACNANPIIFLKYPGNYVFRGLEIMTESHSLSHRLDNAGMAGDCLPNALNDLLKVDAFYTQKFTNLVQMLDSVSEGDGTLLDQSAAIWFNEMSDGNAHNLNNAPIVQAGGAGGYFKTGWAINVHDGSADMSNGNSMSACTDGTSNQMINGTTQSTGTDPDLASAPINKYFCNLMNALGVKANADGYPEKGGTAEVSKFGYSDNTEDFIGGEGAVAGATIHDPGEFTELKA